MTMKGEHRRVNMIRCLKMKINVSDFKSPKAEQSTGTNHVLKKCSICKGKELNNQYTAQFTAVKCINHKNKCLVKKLFASWFSSFLFLCYWKHNKKQISVRFYFDLIYKADKSLKTIRFMPKYFVKLLRRWRNLDSEPICWTKERQVGTFYHGDKKNQSL